MSNPMTPQRARRLANRWTLASFALLALVAVATFAGRPAFGWLVGLVGWCSATFRACYLDGWARGGVVGHKAGYEDGYTTGYMDACKAGRET